MEHLFDLSNVIDNGGVLCLLSLVTDMRRENSYGHLSPTCVAVAQTQNAHFRYRFYVCYKTLT